MRSIAPLTIILLFSSAFLCFTSVTGTPFKSMQVVDKPLHLEESDKKMTTNEVVSVSSSALSSIVSVINLIFVAYVWNLSQKRYKDEKERDQELIDAEKKREDRIFWLRETLIKPYLNQIHAFYDDCGRLLSDHRSELKKTNDNDGCVTELLEQQRKTIHQIKSSKNKNLSLLLRMASCLCPSYGAAAEDILDELIDYLTAEIAGKHEMNAEVTEAAKSKTADNMAKLVSHLNSWAEQGSESGD